MDVRGYFDAWRAGRAATPVAGANFDHASITDGQLVVR